MHRSGTSALTRGLLTLGVQLGAHLMEPMPSVNPKGFWEDMDIYQLNEAMLQSLDSQWYHSTPLSSEQIAQLVDAGFLEQAVALLQSKHQEGQPYAFKDPRLCRLLAFWQQALARAGGKIAYCLALRNPVSIADSLQKRDGMDRTQSYLLWLTHTLNSILLTHGQVRILVNYDHLIQAPGAQMRRMAAGLHLSIEEAALREYAEDFLDKTLRHTRHTQTDLKQDPDCPPMVQSLYRDLLAVAEDRKALDTPALLQRHQRAWKDLQTMRPLLQAMDRMVEALLQPAS